MKLLLVVLLFSLTSWAQTPKPPQTHESYAASDVLKMSRSDIVLGEHIVNMIKFIEKGYINKEILGKVTVESTKTKHFQPFVPWLLAVKDISNVTTTANFISYCRKYSEKKETAHLEKVLSRIASNYCRERALEAITRDIDKTGTISDEATVFIQENLKYFLTKKNKKNFAFFIQSQVSRPAILKKISQEITTYSVQHDIIPSQEVLKDILINEQITKLIQDKGFKPIQNQNVFYAEFGKLIEQGYKVLDLNSDKKTKEHFIFLKNYLDLNEDHLPTGLCLNRINDFAKATFRFGQKDLSQDIFKYVIKKNNKDIHEDALFFYLWTHISLSEYKEALALAKKHNLLKDKSTIQDPRLKFWIAYLYEKIDKNSDAVEYYEDIIQNHPLSYYSIMSVKKVLAIKPNSNAVSFYNSSITKNSPSLSFDSSLIENDFVSSLVRLKVWSKIDSARMIKLEIKRLKLHSMPKFLVTIPTMKQAEAKSDLHLINARIIHDADNYLATFRYIYEVLDRKEVIFNRALLEILYPKPYLKELNVALKKEPLDPIVILSLIRQESVFNPRARSPVGARGLMQLMPTTARNMRRSVRDKHLVNPEINIELGTKYFNRLYKRYDGNLVYVLSAYNAGESRVERWKGQLFDSEATILKNIESIPFLETRNYVKLIFRNIFFYKLLLDKSELTDPSEPNKIYDVKLGFKH
jgi:soluble lytic murein transglycosylase